MKNKLFWNDADWHVKNLPPLRWKERQMLNFIYTFLYYLKGAMIIVVGIITVIAFVLSLYVFLKGA